MDGNQKVKLMYGLRAVVYLIWITLNLEIKLY